MSDSEEGDVRHNLAAQGGFGVDDDGNYISGVRLEIVGGPLDGVTLTTVTPKALIRTANILMVAAVQADNLKNIARVLQDKGVESEEIHAFLEALGKVKGDLDDI